ncbi:MAG: Na+/H+ antiporter subunit C [Candidatus Promineifilaceae bacterium]
MEFVLAIVIGVLYAVGLYLIMRRSLVKLILGIAMLGYGANLLIFTIGRITRDAPPIIPYGAKQLEAPFADPLPQALILTAIVIGFGVLAFTLVLLREAAQALHTGEVEGLDITQE